MLAVFYKLLSNHLPALGGLDNLGCILSKGEDNLLSS
jgi:hypothetical protein